MLFMNWQHLLYFKMAAESTSFSQAAEHLHISPSALSKAIRLLEEELGVPLFLKSGRSCTLTEYGAYFRQRVDDAVNCINAGVAEVQQQASIHVGQVNLTGIYTMCSDFLPHMIRDFSEHYPLIKFSLSSRITTSVLEEVLSDTCDLGFCSEFNFNDWRFSTLDHALIRREEPVFIIPKHHKLANETFADLTKLANENFIVYKQTGGGVSKLFWDLWESTHIKPKVVFEASDDPTIIGLVAAGIGCALVPKRSPLYAENVHVLSFRENPPVRNQYMVWKKTRALSPAAELFRQHVLRVCDAASSTVPQSE